MFTIKTKFNNSEEKRKYIHHACAQIPITITPDYRHLGCPFGDDVNSWCRRGHIDDIEEEDLDSIIAQFNEVLSKESKYGQC